MSNAQKREDDCKSKRKFFSRKQARTQSERATAKYKSRMYFYKCEICRKFHLTKSRPRKFKEETI